MDKAEGDYIYYIPLHVMLNQDYQKLWSIVFHHA